LALRVPRFGPLNLSNSRKQQNTKFAMALVTDEVPWPKNVSRLETPPSSEARNIPGETGLS
jgi:hypothetical protein